MNAISLRYKLFGESAILIEWPAKMDEFILKDILTFQYKIQQKKLEDILEIIQSINSLTVIYNNKSIDNDSLIKTLKGIYKEEFSKIRSKHFLWKIPVCYNFKFGLDLEEISKKNDLSVDEIIELHSNAIYRVFSIGFLPGFLYLGGLDERLYIDRKATPRLVVPKGAVAIGGKQTGVYPKSSPGGWQIIGNSPISFFETTKAIPCFAKPGDQIQFVPVSSEDHLQIQNQITLQQFALEKEVIND